MSEGSASVKVYMFTIVDTALQVQQYQEERCPGGYNFKPLLLGSVAIFYKILSRATELTNVMMAS